MRTRHLAFALFVAPFLDSKTRLASQPSLPADEKLSLASILGGSTSGSRRAATSYLGQLVRSSVLMLRACFCLSTRLSYSRTFGVLAFSMLGLGGSLFASAQAPVALDDRQSFAHSYLAFSLDSNKASQVPRFVTEEGKFHIALSRRSVSIESLKSIATLQSGVTPSRISIEFPGSAKDARMVGIDQTLSSYSVFRSRDRHQWQYHVPLYRQVLYSNLYRGIDLTFHENQQRLEYDFSVHEGADPNLIHLRMNGAQHVDIDASGDLILDMGEGSIRCKKPVVYQGSGSNRKVIEAHYTLAGSGQHGPALVGFALGRYDRNKLLVIDPVLDFSHVLGDGSDSVSGVAADQSGASYVVSGNGLGSFTVRNFGPDGSLQRAAVVAMPQDSAFIQSTGIAVSSGGLVYVSGFAESGLPTTSNAVQESNGGGAKAFLAVLEPKDGSFDLKYLSYLGGPGVSRASGLAVDDTGMAYVAGVTSSEQFKPTSNDFRSVGANAATSVGFVVKVNPFNAGDGSLIYSRLLSSGVLAITADGAGNVYVLQEAVRGAVATPGAFGYDKTLRSGQALLVTKMETSSGRITYSANLGSAHGSAIAVDRSGAVYVTGISASNGLPATAGAYQSQAHGGFVLKLNAAGSGLEYLTYLGGTGGVLPESIAVRKSCVTDCSVYVAGITSASDFPSINPVQSIPGALPAVFVVELTADARGVKYSTLLSDQTSPARIVSLDYDRSSYVAGPSIAVDGRGDAHIAGNLAANPADSRADLPMVILDPGSSAFLAKISGEKQSRLVAIPESIQFGNASIDGVTTSAEFTLRNIGSDDVKLEPFEVIPSNEFALANQCGTVLTAGDSCIVTLRFSPLAPGTRSGTILIQAQGEDTPLIVSLAGNGVSSAGSGSFGSPTALVQTMTTPTGSPTATLSPTSLSFGNQMVGTAPTTLSATLTNTGSASLSVSSVTLGGTNVSQYSFAVPAPKSVCSPTSKLAVGSSCTIGVQWTPALGQSSAAVTIADNAGTGSQTLPLSGNGTGFAVPFVEALKPAVAIPGGAAFTLNLNGTQLAPGATARWNGTSLTTSVLSSTQATAAVPASLIAAGGSGILTLTNPKPTAVISNQKQFLVASSIPTVGFSSTLFPSLAVNQPAAILGVDVNGDFKSDLVVLDALDGEAQVFTNAGSGRLSLKSSPAVAPNPVAVAAGDFNEDGKLDLAVLSSNGTVTILTGDGQGNYPTSTSFLSGSAGQSIVAGDFNGDGHLDLAVLNPSNSMVSLFLGNGADGFTQVSTTPVGVSPYGLIATDFNQDGILDLAVGNGDGTVTVLLGNGSGAFSTAPVVTTGQAAAAIVTGDFNEDGIPDLAVGGSNGTVTILSGAGDGTFTNPSSFNSGSSLSSMVVGDFNADGHQDLIVASASSSQAAVFFGTGKSTFNAGPVLTTGSEPTSLAALDFNVDGYLDLAVASSTANNVQLQFQEPVAAVSQTLLAYGQELINVASQPLPVTIANAGSLPLTLSSISINPSSGTGASDFVQTNTCGTLPAKIPSAGSCTVNMVFTPSKLANESAILVLSDTSGGTSTSQKVSLTGTGVATLTSQIAFTAPPSVFGTAAQVVATVSGAAATPTGSVTLTVGSNVTLTQALVNGSTTFNVTGLLAGNNSFVLNYPAQGIYSASSAAGTLSVSQSTPVLQWAQPAPIPTGLPLGSLQLNATASTPGTFAYLPPIGTLLGIGNNQVLKATFTPTDSVDFTSASISTTINVTPNPASQISFTAPPSVFGTVAQVLATVTGSTGTPTGSLTLTVGSNTPVTQTLVNGATAFNVTGLPTGNTSFVLNYPAQGLFTASSATGILSVNPSTPVLQWAQPVPIPTAVPIGSTQLNATASVPGTFTYQPPAGTLLGIGNNQALNATFTPTDSVDFTTASISTTINVTANPVPFVNPILPSAIGPATAAAGFTLNLKGTGFVPTTAVKFNGKTLTTSVTGSTSLAAAVPANFITSATTLLVKVFNPEHTKGGLAQTVFLPVTNPTLGTFLAPYSNPSLSPVNTPGQMAVGQFDSSGFEDIAVLDSADGTVRLYYGTANGTYFFASSEPVGINPVSIAMGDFNEDGKTDWAVADSTGNITILTGNGTGAFTPLPSFFSGSAASFVAVADLNLDGHADLAVINPIANTVEVFWGTGTGSFTPGTQFSTGQGPTSLVIADFNGDGYPDIAVSNSDGTISVYLGNSNGTYTAAASPSTGSSATAIATGDFNEDGIPDLAITGSNGNTTILLGVGDGTFTAAPTIALSSGTQSIGVGDFNGDGHLDLAVANQNASSLTVLLGSGNGEFVAQPAIATTGAPTALSVVDMNGDGRLDIALSSTGSNAVYTYFQAPNASPSTSSVNFGVPLEGAASSPQSVTISNAGSAPLTISAFAITPGQNANAGDFSQTNTCGALPATVLPGASCSVSIVLTASTTLPESASLVITDNSSLVSSNTQTVSLADNGAIGHPSQTTVTPGPSIVFGGATTATVSLTSQYGTPPGFVTLTVDSFAPISQQLTNGGAVFQLTGLTAGVHQLVALYPTQVGGFQTSTGTSTITVTKASPTVTWASPAAIVAGVPLSSAQLNATASVAGSYVYSPPSGTVLPAGNSQGLSVSFIPADTNDYNVGSATTSINVLASSTAVYVAPSSFNFNGQIQGIASAVQNVSLLNKGTSAITLKSLSIGGSSYAIYSTFSLASGTNICAKSEVIGAGSSCTLGVSFKPTALGPFTATLSVSYVVGTGTAQTTIAVPLSATGIANPVPFVQPIVPSAVASATAESGFTLSIPGAGFDSSSVVSMNGKALTTQLVTNSSGVTSLQATVPSGLVTAESSGMITVANAKPTGLVSNNLGSVAFTNPLNTSNFLLGPFAPTTVNMPSTVLAVDVNGDHYPDVVVLDTKDNEVLTYINANSGHVTLASTIGITAGNITGVAAGDFNEDGKLDLAVATSNGEVTILLGNGSGSYTAQTPFSAGSSAQGIAAADLNSDGHWDLVVTNPTAGTATVLLGLGTGSFTSAATLTTGVSPYGVVIADFNLDGIPDIAVGNADGSVSVFLASAGGVYLPASTPDTGAPALAIVSGDFNEDGIPDLAVLNTDNSVTLLTGTGTGVFNIAAQAAVGNSPQSMSIGDLNGDGHLDLLVANNADNTVSILYGTGTGSFNPQLIAPVAPGPLSVSVADMNNDGRVDFVVSSGTNNAFSVLMQTPLTAFSASSLSFGSEVYGVTTPSQTFTMSNNGSGPLFVSSFGVHSGYDSPDFGMTTTCGTAPFTLNPQTSCTITIGFTPAKIGNESAMFNVVDNSGNVGGTPHYVTFTGMGLAVPTTIAMSAPTTATYGNTITVNTSMTSATGVLPHGLLTLTVGNYAPLTQRLLTDGTAAFQVTGLPVGTYTLVANWAAQFQFATSQAIGTVTVQQATPTINWPAPASITQGTPLTSAQLNASSTVTGTYVYSPPASTVLSAGNNQPLNVTFTPLDTVNYTGTTAANTINVLSAPPTLAITESSLSFGSLAMGTSSAPQTSTLINFGTTPIVIGGIAISGTNSSSFQFVSPAPGTSCFNMGGSLAPGASCTLNVYFNPAANGSLSANIVVSDNAGSGSQTIALGGTGNYNPTPFVEKISPTAVSPSVASGGFTLNVEGVGFASGASLFINGQAVPATLQNSTHLQVQIPAGVISTNSTPILTIVNPGTTGDRASNPIPLPITSATSSVVIGTGPFPPTPVNTPQEMTVADFNGDGIPDVAVADHQDGTVRVYLGAASGTLTLQSTLSVGVTPTSICYGDFNEDGHLDLAVLSSNGTFSIWFGDGAGNFTAGPTTAATPFGNHIAAADFNGDGHLDIAVVDAVDQIVVIMTGTGTGSFGYASTLYTGSSPYGLAIADFNLDGILDLAVGDGDGTVGIFLGNGDGTFTQATSFDTGTPASALTAGDFNEDGIPDLAVANDNSAGLGTNGSVSIWRGAGTGLFTFASQNAAGNNPSAIVAGDFNGDGHLDLAVANQSSNYIQILMGSGASTFISSGPLQSGNGPTALGVGDFNSDGRLDLVALDAASNSIGILFQQPQATLSASSLTFGSQAIGTSSAAQSFTITNTGSATAPLGVSSISLTPAYNTGVNDFQESNFCQASLPPGGTCTINVVFSPSYVATENATLTVSDNSMGVPTAQSVALSGTAPLPTGVLATSQINPTAPTMTVPPSFMGMSFDWNTAESWLGSTTTGADPIIQQLLSNLMAYSPAPFQIRVSADSYNMTGTIDSATALPFAQLAQNMNVHYILGLNLDLDSVSLTQSQASAYVAAVPNNSIDAFEIGNEPDNYVSNGARGNNYGIQPYLTERSTFMQGVEAVAPSLERFADPALASSGWLSGIEAGLLAGNLPGNIVTQHSYLTCYNAKNPFPLDQLLQNYATYSAPRLWGTFATVAHQAGQAFRIGELNSVCQGGQPGLSNNFTSALWSIDTMFAFLSSGVDGVNWHTSAGTYYNAFNLNVATKSGKNTYTLGGVNPLYYGMLLFAQATGNGAKMLPISNLTNANLDIWATVDNSGTVHVVVINKDEVQTGSVQISVPGYNSAVALPLTASSYTATNGVRYAGQTFDGSTNGTIQGTQVTQTITPSNGVFSISVPTTSAVLLNLTQ
jgi:hypothetical protein